MKMNRILATRESEGVEFRFAPPVLRAMARQEHFSPRFFASRFDPRTGGVEYWAWNTRRAQYFSVDDTSYAEQYLV